MPTKKPRATFFLTLTPDLATYFKKQVKGCATTVHTEPLSVEKLDKKTEILGVFVDSKVDKKVLDHLPHLRLIVAFSTGYDNIDMIEAKKRKITVCNVPTYGEATVAEHALTLMLALAKNLFVSAKRVKEGTYDYHGLRGFDLEGKTIGIVGTGKIGARLAELLSGFRVTLLAYDPFPKKELEKKYKLTYVPLSTLYKKSDIISLHVPLIPKTEHMIDRAAIKKMKPGVVLVNTARGGLVDSEALLWGLEKGAVAGAGLDVLDQEDLLKDPMLFCGNDCPTRSGMQITLMNNMLIDHPRVIVTPHTAFNTTEAVKRILTTTAENITAFTKGRPQNTIVL